MRLRQLGTKVYGGSTYVIVVVQNCFCSDMRPDEETERVCNVSDTAREAQRTRLTDCEQDLLPAECIEREGVAQARPDKDPWFRFISSSLR